VVHCTGSARWDISSAEIVELRQDGENLEWEGPDGLVGMFGNQYIHPEGVGIGVSRRPWTAEHRLE
jgi:hypothetical protein